jgi:transketolase
VDILEHQSKCPEQEFLCEFNCGEKLVERDRENHNLDNVHMHVQCLQKELNLERKKRKLDLQNERKIMQTELTDWMNKRKKELESDRSKWTMELEYERKKYRSLEGELKSVREILERKKVVNVPAAGSQKQIDELKVFSTTGRFISDTTTYGFIIHDNGRR